MSSRTANLDGGPRGDTADRDAILHILDGLIAKNRVRDALHEAS